MTTILQDNVTSAVPILEPSPITYNVTEETVVVHVIQESDQSSHNQSYENITTDTAMNHILTRVNITSALNHNIYKPSSVTHYGEHVVPVTTQRPLSYSRRPIYIRGHLLYHPDKQTFHPNVGPHGALRAPNDIHLSRADNFREEPVGKNNRKTRKKSSTNDRFYNYKILFDTMKVCSLFYIIIM
jgi:hypothetical protein